MTMDKALTWFMGGWLGVAVIVNILAILGLMLGAQTFWAGLGRVQDMFSPFDIRNYLFELILISPAYGAYVWRDKRRNRVQNSN